MTLTLELPPEREAAVEEQAKRNGLTTQEWLLRIVEKAAPLPPAESAEKDDRSVSAMFREIWADMPDEVRAKLPSDGADEHDHYIYGTPKRMA